MTVKHSHLPRGHASVSDTVTKESQTIHRYRLLRSAPAAEAAPFGHVPVSDTVPEVSRC
jgi:hypothetical protein